MVAARERAGFSLAGERPLPLTGLFLFND